MSSSDPDAPSLHDRPPTAAVGSKFHPDGSPRAFPGYSVIRFLDPASPATELLCQIQAELAEVTPAGCFAFLPPESFHVTLIDLVCDQLRRPEVWSGELSLDQPFSEVGTWLAERLDPLLARPFPAFLGFQGLYWPETSLMPILEPVDDCSHASHRGLREEIAEATGIRHPGHEHYGFHLTLAYRLFELSDRERRTLEDRLSTWNQRLRNDLGVLPLAPPELVYFPDMTRFLPVR